MRLWEINKKERSQCIDLDGCVVFLLLFFGDKVFGLGLFVCSVLHYRAPRRVLNAMSFECVVHRSPIHSFIELAERVHWHSRSAAANAPTAAAAAAASAGFHLRHRLVKLKIIFGAVRIGCFWLCQCYRWSFLNIVTIVATLWYTKTGAECSDAAYAVQCFYGTHAATARTKESE